MSLIRSAQLNGHDPHAYLKVAPPVKTGLPSLQFTVIWAG
ncbi:Mobile element protein [Paraburkholderia caribensis MBA4]|uniref:Mobile element protein n=1 Tax=Paraburkholderia caribensis MBA4 TaxID=1323664 RepID=A0A0P0R881_9BURK|nr:Mobile element protein [Paraburkholderia caribensis MBA4]